MSEPDQTGPGLGQGGGEQGEQLEGSLTDGGSLPGVDDEDRSFGAGRTGDVGEGGGAMSGRGQEEGEDGRSQARDAHAQAERNRPDEDVADAGPSGEQSGYGNTPPR